MHNVFSMYTLHSSYCMYISPPSHLPLPLVVFGNLDRGEESRARGHFGALVVVGSTVVKAVSHGKFQQSSKMDAGG